MKAFQEGHFILSSGLHSSVYLQSAIVLSFPNYLKEIAKNLCLLIRDKVVISDIDTVVSPAMGGVVIGSKVGEILQKQAIFLERVNSQLVFRRGFSLKKKSNVIIIEDVITTGKSSQECVDTIKRSKANVSAVFSIIDRSSEKSNTNLSVPKYSLVRLHAPIYKHSELPENLKKIPVIKPGSRFLK